MTQKDVYEQFKTIFPNYAEKLDAWFPNGKNSVRIRLTDKQQFVFTYNKKHDWTFETVDSFVNRIKG